MESFLKLQYGWICNELRKEKDSFRFGQDMIWL